MISRVKALAPAIQDSGAALLLDGHVELVARAGADGAHLTGIEAMEDALPTLEARPHRRRRRADDAARFDGRGRGRRGLRAVRRTRCERAAAFGRGDRRTAAMVGRTVRAAVRRLCGVARGDRRIRGSRRGFRSGRRFHLGRSARRGGGADWMPSRRSGRRMPRCPEKSKPNRDNAGNEDPASDIDPDELPDVDGERGGANLADASCRRYAAGSRANQPPSRKPNPRRSPRSRRLPPRRRSPQPLPWHRSRR